MPNYGLHQLINSREIPRFVGSPVAELASVAQHLQGKYDTAIQGDDALDSALTQASSLGADNAMLQQIKDQYRAKLKERAAKGDYEHMLRDVQKDARDFVNQYKPIAANQAAVSEYYKDLQEQVTKGDVSKSWADRLYDSATRGYQGLKKNAQTGQLENQFRGTTAVKDINMEEWVDKALKGLDPKKIGTDVQWIKDGFYRKHGETSEKLTMKEIWPALQAAMGSDPMFQSYAQQKMMLDSYSAKYITEEGSKNAPFYAAVRKLADETGMSFNQAAERHFADTSWADLNKNIQGIGAKYIKDNWTTENAVLRETEQTGRDEAEKLKKKGDVVFGLTYAGLDNAANVEDADQFDKIKSNADTRIAGAQKDFGDWLNAKDSQGGALRKVESVGTGANAYERFYEKDPSGKWIDVTSIGNTKRSQFVNALQTKQQLDDVQKAAEVEAKFDPKQLKPEEVTRAAGKVMDKYQFYQGGFNLVVNSINALRAANGNIAAFRPFMDALGVKDQIAFKKDLNEALKSESPGYARYEKALTNRINGGVAANEILEINDESARKSLKGLLTTSAGQGIGLKNGISPLTIGTGKDQGKQLSADEYNEVMSTLEPVGVINDMGNGKTKVLFRTTQEVKGKKVQGENLIVEADNITGMQEYLSKSLSPRDYTKFAIDGQLKAQLGTNVSGMTSFNLGVDKAGNPVDIKILRQRDNKVNTFTVDFPTTSGLVRKQFDSYGAVADAIAQYQMLQNAGQ